MILRLVVFLIAVAVLAAGCSNTTTPADATLGQIKGTVVTNNGSPVKGALISTTPGTREVRTNDDGVFLIPVVPAGEYAITATAGDDRGRVITSVEARQNTIVTIVLGVLDPGDDEPGDDEPGDDEPGDDEPGDDEPGDDEPGDDEPGDDDPGDDRPDMPLGLRVFLPLDGQANDLIRTLPDGRMEGAQRTTNRMGMPGRAMYFDGKGSYIEMPIPQRVNLLELPATWSFWLRPDRSSALGSGQYQSPIGISRPPMPDGFLTMWEPQGFVSRYSAGQGTTRVSAGAPLLRDGAWHHVAITITEQGMAFYLDGQLVSGGPWQGRPMVARVPHPLRLGVVPADRMGANLPTPRPYSGAIDDVMLFNRALNVMEIQALARL